MTAEFPKQQPGLNYLTEGGQETEIMYKYGYDLPHFAMFPLLDNPRAVTELSGMYGRYLDTAARHGFGVVVGGLDYRASPDWGSLLGYSSQSLAEMQLRAIDFLREVAQPYAEQLPAWRRIRDQPDDYHPGVGGVPQRTARHAGSCRRRLGRGDDVQQCRRGNWIGPCRGARWPSPLGLVHAG